jgi:formylglycine-generating enzyme required for sulfatase activity
MLYQFQGDDLKRATTRYANELWQALQMNERVRDLATNPLLLTVVAVIYHNNYVLPEDRAALYEECIEVLLRGGRGKADRAAQTRRQYSGKPELSMGLHPRRELLSAVAYTMHQRGEQGRIIERQDLIRTVATRLPTRPDADEAARAFVAELPVHIGLLDEVQPDRFRFSHLSFQEFLAARHIAETDQWDELLAHYRENWWREVILLCAGHLSQARCWRFLGKLIKQGQTSSDRAEALGLATDAIAELERFKGQGPLNKQIIRQAWGILEAQPAPAVPAVARVECGRVLARLGDPRRAVNDLPPEMVQIAGGTFVIGNTKEAARDDDEVNDLPLTVPTFKIARYPVTNAQWKLFLDDDGYNPDAPWWDAAGQAWLRKSDRLKTLSRYDKHLGIALPNHPVVTITWYEAMAFCRWLSQHQGYNPHGNQYTLPSEAEWEYAARRATCRIYPWGNDQPDAKHANFARTYNGTTTPGCFPVGTTVEDGIHDLTGNVWEWTRSIYRPYPYNPGDGREDISKPSINEWVMRGSGWRDLGWAVSFQNQLNPLKFQWNRLFVLRASKRLYKSPDSYGSDVGVRLVQLVLDT